MVKFLIPFLFIPLLSSAQQKRIPRFENDTLYTGTGHRIYDGIKLKFGTGVRNNSGSFLYINIKTEQNSAALTGNSFTVNRMLNFGMSVLKNTYIEIKGTVIYKDGSKGGVDLHISIDSAISTGEIIMPEDQVPYIPPASAFQTEPLFKNDTLVTSTGSVIFVGKELQFGNGSGKNGDYKYIILKGKNTMPDISNTRFVVKKLNRFGLNRLNQASIDVVAALQFKDGSRGKLNLSIAYDDAIAASELIVP